MGLCCETISPDHENPIKLSDATDLHQPSAHEDIRPSHKDAPKIKSTNLQASKQQGSSKLTTTTANGT